jgi:uridine kinase
LKKGILIGITGASGSGKTLVAENIYKQLGSENVVIMEEDSYYRDLSNIPFDERSGLNFDHPNAFDHELLSRHIQELLSGQPAFTP